jgi:pimeloyl-ACP methyl ester carboxylesterase
MRNSWGQDSPLFRQIFTEAFFPTASASETAFFNELQRRTTTPENASRILDALGDVDVRAELSRVKVPTLVLHSRGDQIIPISDGMELAAGIEGARFVSIDSSNHMLLSHEPGWQRVCAEIDRFADSLTPS